MISEASLLAWSITDNLIRTDASGDESFKDFEDRRLLRGEKR